MSGQSFRGKSRKKATAKKGLGVDVKMLLNYILLCREEIRWEEMKQLHLAQARPLSHSCEHSN